MLLRCTVAVVGRRLSFRCKEDPQAGQEFVSRDDYSRETIKSRETINHARRLITRSIETILYSMHAVSYPESQLAITPYQLAVSIVIEW
jgi:hypothetical protein